ncbi:PSRC1 protein, partial [Toxostoma redivivum]|nr:PSRC1 protein [Toxostoma redivivum]
GVGGDPPAPAGGPGAPRRWPRTEVRQRQRCVSPVFTPWGGGGPVLIASVPPDVRFVTEESFDFGVLSPSDRYRGGSEDRAPRGWEQGGQGTLYLRQGGAQSPAPPTLASPTPGPPPPLSLLAVPHHPLPSPRCPLGLQHPRRQTFVVKDSPVRALLPVVESRGPAAPIPHLPAKPQGASAATSVPRAPPSRNSTAVAKGPSGSRGLPSSRMGLPRPCPPQGQGAGARGRSEPPRGGTAGSDGKGTGTPWPWGFLGHIP